MSGWTDERLERAARLWNSGFSASIIAHKLGGVSRNAVIGVIHRRKLSTRSPQAAPATFAVKPRRDVKNVRHSSQVVSMARVKAMRREPEPSPALIDVTHAKPWTERAFGECAYPVSGAGADTLSCCQPAGEKGYCKAHWAVMTKPLTPTDRKRLQRLGRLAA